MVNPCMSWLEEVSADEVVVDADEIREEAIGNLRYFSVTREEAAAVTLDDIDAFAAKVVDACRAQLLAQDAPPMVIYWWHDFQAGHLRFSMVSAAHGRLPFGCRVIPAAGIRQIAEEWLSSPWLHGIDLSTLRCAPLDEPEPEPEVYTLAVWAVQLP